MKLTPRYLLILGVVALIAAFVGALVAGAQEPPKVPDSIPVSEIDSLSWERYQLLQRLAAAQQDLLRLQNEKTLAEEFAKLDRRFREHYKLGVDQVERRGDQWILRPTSPPATTK